MTLRRAIHPDNSWTVYADGKPAIRGKAPNARAAVSEARAAMTQAAPKPKHP